MKLKVAMKVLFTEMERYLIRNNKSFVVGSESSSESSSCNEMPIGLRENEGSQYYSALLADALPKAKASELSSKRHSEDKISNSSRARHKKDEHLTEPHLTDRHPDSIQSVDNQVPVRVKQYKRSLADDRLVAEREHRLTRRNKEESDT